MGGSRWCVRSVGWVNGLGVAMIEVDRVCR